MRRNENKWTVYLSYTNSWKALRQHEEWRGKENRKEEMNKNWKKGEGEEWQMGEVSCLYIMYVMVSKKKNTKRREREWTGERERLLMAGWAFA